MPIESSRVVRSGRTLVDRSARWSGRLEWPLSIGFLPGAGAASLARRLDSTWAVQRGFARVLALEHYRSRCDLLLVPQELRGADWRSLKGVADAITLFDPRRSASLEEALRIRREAQSGAAGILNIPIERADQWLDKLLEFFSHDLPFGEAAALATDQFGGRQPGFVVAPGFLKAARLSNMVTRMAGELRSMSDDVEFSVPDATRDRFGLGSVLAGATARPSELGTAIGETMRDVSFLQESEGATGASALGKAIRDVETGPRVRFGDAMIFRTNAGRKGDRLPSSSSLAAGREYWLEFAFRSQRVGIGYDAEPKGIKPPSEAVEVQVVLSAPYDSDVRIPDPLQTIKLPVEGDSGVAAFRFTPLQAPDSVLTLEMRVFYRLNLLEHVVLNASLLRQEQDPGPRPQQLSQPSTYRRFDGDIAKAPMPKMLSIDIRSATSGYWLTFATPQSDGVALVANPPLTSDLLRALLVKLRDRWLEIGLTTFGSGLTSSTPTVGEESLRNLALAGSELWTTLFSLGAPRGSTAQLGNFLRANPMPDGSAIQISVAADARGFVFPWALLYDRDVAPVGKPVDALGFWGLRYDIEQRIDVPPFADPPDRDGQAVSLALFLDGTISLASEQQKLAEALAGASAGKLKTRPPVVTRRDMRAALESGEDHLLYFFCHGRSALPFDDWLVHLRRLVKKKSSSPSLQPLANLLDGAVLDGSDTALKLTRHVISLNELLAIHNVMKNEPIVFLNMCESAQVLPDVSNSFVSFFLNRYAGAVLGTECPVPPDFASAFARDILPRLLAGAPVGQTLVSARRRMIDQYRNPLGLAYSLWGSTTATCVPQVFGEDVAETFASSKVEPVSVT